MFCLACNTMLTILPSSCPLPNHPPPPPHPPPPHTHTLPPFRLQPILPYFNLLLTPLPCSLRDRCAISVTDNGVLAIGYRHSRGSLPSTPRTTVRSFLTRSKLKQCECPTPPPKKKKRRRSYFASHLIVHRFYPL